MECRHESHVHDFSHPIKTDGSSLAKKESCDPWHQFWLLLRLPALNLLGILYVGTWPSSPAVGPGTTHGQQGFSSSASYPGSLIAFHMSSPLFLLCAVCVSPVLILLSSPPTRQLGPGDSFSWSLGKQIQVVPGSELQATAGRSRAMKLPAYVVILFRSTRQEGRLQFNAGCSWLRPLLPDPVRQLAGISSATN